MRNLIGVSAIAITMAVSGVAMAQSGSSSSGMSGSSSSGASSTGAMTKMSQSECESVWSRLDSGKAGNVTQAQAQNYVVDFKSVDTNNDGQVSHSEFQAGCDKGLVRSASAGTGSSLGGSSATGAGSSSGGSSPGIGSGSGSSGGSGMKK